MFRLPLGPVWLLALVGAMPARAQTRPFNLEKTRKVRNQVVVRHLVVVRLGLGVIEDGLKALENGLAIVTVAATSSVPRTHPGVWPAGVASTMIGHCHR